MHNKKENKFKKRFQIAPRLYQFRNTEQCKPKVLSPILAKNVTIYLSEKLQSHRKAGCNPNPIQSY